jgi:hypothetical protein
MDGIYPTSFPLLTARALETLLLPPMLLFTVGGLAEVIPGLLVFFTCFVITAGNNHSSDIVACPDKGTWGVRYVSSSIAVVMDNFDTVL